MLEGVLVDLVPYGDRFLALDHKWYNSEAQFYWAMGDRWLSTQAGIDRMHEWIAENRERDHRIRFGVQTKDGTPIGLFGISRYTPHDRRARLTAMIGEPDYWGGGYGTDVLLLVVEYAFDWLDVYKVWLGTMSLNARVMHQMEKVGFRLEGRSREAAFVDGEWADVLAYGLLREEWPGRSALIEKLGLRAKTP